MSEKLRHSVEHKIENTEEFVESQKNLERIERAAIEAKEHKIDVNEIQKNIEKHAKSSETIKVDKAEVAPSQELGSYGAIKSQTYTRTLSRVQARLSAPEKAMSKLMHHKVIEPMSEFAGKTIARPSGILGGGMLALIGSTILVFMSKYYGFRYNFFVFFILLLGGFILGILGELTLRAIAKSKHS